MSFDAAVVSALYGSYDTLKPALPQTDLSVDWVLITDDPSLRGSALGWRVVYLPKTGMHPNRAAKAAKLFPWEFTSAPASVWIDASFRVLSDGFVAGALALADPIAQFPHPWRDCVYQEAEASSGLLKYAGEDFDAQVKDYREQGHPEHWGLWAGGVIARRHTGLIRELSDDWGELITKGTFQDQVSQPVALRYNGLRPALLPDWHMGNEWVRYEGSERHC